VPHASGIGQTHDVQVATDAGAADRGEETRVVGFDALDVTEERLP
jgi:hypothetical protein